jgi:hypothetical protein
MQLRLCASISALSVSSRREGWSNLCLHSHLYVLEFSRVALRRLIFEMGVESEHKVEGGERIRHGAERRMGDSLPTKLLLICEPAQVVDFHLPL